MYYRVKQAVGPYATHKVGDVIEVPEHSVAEREGWLERVAHVLPVDEPGNVQLRVMDVVQKVE